MSRNQMYIHNTKRKGTHGCWGQAKHLRGNEGKKVLLLISLLLFGHSCVVAVGDSGVAFGLWWDLVSEVALFSKSQKKRKMEKEKKGESA